MSGSTHKSGAYTKVGVETASQGKLVVMLFNGAIQRAEEAKRQIERRNLQGAHDNLVRSQEIVTELRSALNMNIGQVSHNLDRLYEYFQHLLVKANIRKETTHIDECVSLMTEMRDTWHEAFDKAAREQGAKPGAPAINPHGSKVINMQG